MHKRTLITALFLLWAQTAQAADVGLKISSANNWYSWGDYILGQDLKLGLEQGGHKVFPYYIDNFYDDKHADIDIYMHGFIPFNPPKEKNKINVMYLYYPLETANMQKYKNLTNVSEPRWYSLETELWNFDLIAVASPTYKEEIARLGLKTIFTPQFTNPEKFFYEYDAAKAYDILFVGRPGYERISAKWAIESGFDVALFGSGWQEKAPAKYFKGDYIDNAELHKYYASAKIVLNDTREDMKRAGFISNRVFDVTASGGFLISDYMPEIEQFYGDSIPMFKSKEELKNLIEYYLEHPDERTQKAKRAQEITLKNFTNKIIAEKIMNAAQDLSFTESVSNLAENTLAIKMPWGSEANLIGDYWLGIDLDKGLKNVGFATRDYYYDDGFHEDNFYQTADNLLYLQFKYNRTDFEDDKKAKIMYLYFPTFIPDKGKFINTKDEFRYNTDAHLNNDLEYFDIIATPAKEVYKELQQNDYPTAFIPQFTNPEKFHSSPDDNLKTDLLFVGSTWYDRVSALYAVELGYDIAIYGLNWQEKVDKKYIKGIFIDNNELYRYYSSAKIVLSDHADDLSAMGLVPNRLYDATACGAFVISEYSPYIEEIFGDNIPMFKDKEEFKKLVDFYLAHPEERAKKAKRAQEITLNGYTNTIIGQKLKDLFSQIRKAKQ